jgi:hypothetical protein
LQLSAARAGQEMTLANAARGLIATQLGVAVAHWQSAGQVAALEQAERAAAEASWAKQLEVAQAQVATGQNLLAVDQARVGITQQRMQMEEANFQRHLQMQQREAQGQAQLAGGELALADQRVQQTLKAMGDPRLRMMTGTGPQDVMRAWDARERKEQAIEQTRMAEALLKQSTGDHFAVAQAKMQNQFDHNALVDRQYEEGKHMRELAFQTSFATASGQMIPMGTNEMGLGSALIGGDNERIKDILEDAHRESGAQLKLVDDGLEAMRHPDVRNLRQVMLEAVQERDRRLIEEIGKILKTGTRAF